MTDRPADTAPITDVYHEAFTRHCHELLAMGHQRLTGHPLANLEETAITGMLCDQMNNVTDAPDRPDWANHVTVIDDQPESVRGKTGKRRPRTDICVSCTQRRPRSLFRFEAKRLNNAASVTTYLGDNGMCAMITGHYGNLPVAGMIGYVQTDSCTAWTTKIKAAIQADPPRYHAVTPLTFTNVSAQMPHPVFSSRHAYKGQQTITHTLLPCV